MSDLTHVGADGRARMVDVTAKAETHRVAKAGGTIRMKAATLDASLPGIRVEATSQAVARTGVEMEALVAVSVALLTIYDMAKAIDREMIIGDIVLLAKTGGKTGPWSRLDGTAVAP